MQGEIKQQIAEVHGREQQIRAKKVKFSFC